METPTKMPDDRELREFARLMIRLCGRNDEFYVDEIHAETPCAAYVCSRLTKDEIIRLTRRAKSGWWC